MGIKGVLRMNIEYQCNKEEQKLYKIGMFSQMNRITVKALRYYDDVGILKPEYVDEQSGYRYYTSKQLPQLHTILALRDMGFGINDIQQILKGASEQEMLHKKKRELMRDLASIYTKLSSIESYLADPNHTNEYRIIMKSLPKVSIASMTRTIDGYQELFDLMPLFGLEMEKVGCECAEPEYCFTIYHDDEYRETDIHAEFCQAIDSIKTSTPLVSCKVLEEVPLAACVLHKGPYHTLPNAYRYIVQYIEENGYEIIGHQRESYIDGIWNQDHEEDWLTELQFPVRMK